MFYLFWCSLFRSLFVPFGVILSSFISHIARYAPSSTYKKHTRKKNENQLDIIFRTPQKSRLFYLVRDIVSTFAATFMNQMNKKYERSQS